MERTTLKRCLLTTILEVTMGDGMLVLDLVREKLTFSTHFCKAKSLIQKVNTLNYGCLNCKMFQRIIFMMFGICRVASRRK